jgi:phage FluMu protein Com
VENEKKYCCKNCRKVLFFGDIIEGYVSKDCPGCGERNIFRVERTITERFELVRKINPLNGFKRTVKI